MRFRINCLNPLESLTRDALEDQVVEAAKSGANILLLRQDLLAECGVDLSSVEAVSRLADLTPDLILVGAERIGDELAGFIVCDSKVYPQPSIGEGEGHAPVNVVDTSAGSIACLPGDDILFAEYGRLAMFAGAEVVLNPGAEPRDHRAASRFFSRGARAWENHFVVASAWATGAGIWDYTGEPLAHSQLGSVEAVYDLHSLRQRRKEPWVNFPAQLRTGLYQPIYETKTTASPEPEVEAYDVLLMQTQETFATSLADRHAAIEENLNRLLPMTRAFARKPSTRLVVYPEFFLQGSPFGVPLEAWEDFGIRVPGPETAVLGKLAQECNVYLAGAVLEYDPDWPLRFFNTAFVLSPEGEVVLRYRKLQCADLNGLLGVTTPGNIYTEYVERYGYEALFPTVDTPIGRLGAAVCFDSNWPELWRALALKGVDVVCNPTSEIHSERVPSWYRTKQAHAAENLYYVASANAGCEQLGPSAPITHMNRGHSCLIDFSGRLAAKADGPGIVPLSGRIDLGALRRARNDPDENILARFRPEAVAQAYSQFPGFPLDIFAEDVMRSAAEGPALVASQIEALLDAGVFKK